ncbi:unnamed protein product [Closterium sp. NIES-53]
MLITVLGAPGILETAEAAILSVPSLPAGLTLLETRAPDLRASNRAPRVTTLDNPLTNVLRASTPASSTPTASTTPNTSTTPDTSTNSTSTATSTASTPATTTPATTTANATPTTLTSLALTAAALPTRSRSSADFLSTKDIDSSNRGN